MIRQSTSGRRAKSPAVLVIGGESIISDYLGHRLRPLPCEVVTARLPSQALQCVTQRPIPLVICDDRAPSMRSFDLMGEIKTRSPATQVVLLVPSGSPDQERRARAAGADAYVPYSFAQKRLAAILDEVFASNSF